MHRLGMRSNPPRPRLTLMVMALALVATLGSGASAQIEQETCDPGFVIDDQTGACVPDPSTDVVTADEPDGEVPAKHTPTPAVTPEPPAGQTATLEVHAWGCEIAGDDPESVPVPTLPDPSCGVLGGVSFDLATSEGTFPAVSDGDGLARWHGLPGGDATVTGYPPDGYVSLAASCPSSQVSATSIAIQLSEGVATTCTWIYGRDTRSAGFQLMAYTCPPGMDPAGHTLQDLAATCAVPSAGVAFELASADDVYSLTVDGSGSIGLGDLQQGPAVLTELVPPGYGQPLAWCATGETQPAAMTMTGASITLELQAHATTSCLWFDVPPEEPASGASEATSTPTDIAASSRIERPKIENISCRMTKVIAILLPPARPGPQPPLPGGQAPLDPTGRAGPQSLPQPSGRLPEPDTCGSGIAPP